MTTHVQTQPNQRRYYILAMLFKLGTLTEDDLMLLLSRDVGTKQQRTAIRETTRICKESGWITDDRVWGERGQDRYTITDAGHAELMSYRFYYLNMAQYAPEALEALQ